MVKYAYISREVKVPLDEGVSFKLEGKQLEITGPRGTVGRDFRHAKNIQLSVVNEDTIAISAKLPKRKELALVGTLEGHIKNMISGVTKGFTYKLKIVYSHFPITVKVNKKSNNVEIQNFIGERGHRVVPIRGDVNIKTTKEDVIIEGSDKELVGQNAANIQLKCKIKDKDLRIFQDGIYVYEKLVGDQVFWKVKT
ncbi:50S ribosomal protein L6 [Candidatus Bathyarchaeota archaeon]|nr:50S ribosomal protein L6 [Candidatus Bathyarchaeota archaeon]